MKNTIKHQINLKGRVRVITTKAGTKKVLRKSKWWDNLIVSGNNTGINLIAQRLGGINTYSLNITHADIGTGTTNPSNSDTELETPVARAPISSQEVVNNIVTLRFFFSDAVLPNGTYYEFGTFVDGLAGISTGKLFNRVLFGSPYTKSSGEDSTFEVEITINA